MPCNPLCGQTGEYQRGCGNDTNSTTKNFIFVLSPLLIILIMLFTNWSPVWLLLTRSLADYPNGHNIRQSLRKWPYMHIQSYGQQYVCVYVHAYVYEHVCVHVFRYTFTSTYTCTHMYTYMHVCICAYVYMCICVCVYACICVFVYVSVYVWLYAYERSMRLPRDSDMDMEGLIAKVTSFNQA